MITLPLDSPRRRSAILIEQACIKPGQRVLDASLYGKVGHGAVFLAILAKRTCPEAVVTGIYEDRHVLEKARREAEGTALSVELRAGKPSSPQFEPESFDTIISSLLLHHLTRKQKLATLSAFHALLVPGGQLHLVDWTRPEPRILALSFLGVRMSDGFQNTADHAGGRVAALIEEAGFAGVEERRREIAIPGCLGFYRGQKAA
jgi:SAM-dependent methyltransferase